MVDHTDNAPPLDLEARSIRPGRAISLNEVSAIAREVRELIASGQEYLAFERVRSLHPADMGLIISGLPRTSRDTMVRVMSPDTVAWMLRQMNPVEAARVGTRLGVQALTFVLQQMHPQHALATLRRLPLHRSQALAGTLDEALTDIDLNVQATNSAGSLMVAEYPLVSIDGTAEDARDSVRALSLDRLMFTYVFVVGPGDQLLGQIPMVDLALAQSDAPIESLSLPIVASVSTETEAHECARLRRQCGRRVGGRSDLERHSHAAALAHGQSRNDLPRRRDDRPVRIHADPGSRAGGLLAGRRRAGGHRRNSDADIDRAHHRVGRTRRCLGPATAGPRSRARCPAWRLVGHPRGSDCDPREAELRPRAGPRGSHVGQHDHRRLSRGGGASVPAPHGGSIPRSHRPSS